MAAQRLTSTLPLAETVAVTAVSETAIACLIIGIDDHVGAYLARLLDARGVGNRLGGVGGTELVKRLGIADAIAITTVADAARAAAEARLVFAVSDGSAERADLVADVIDAIAVAARPPRLLHVADIADLAVPAVCDTVRRVAATSNVERATLLLAAHDSRLGRRDTVMARIIGAAFATNTHDLPPRLHIAETGPRDWGWTAEYVDAVQRMASRDRLTDVVVASGHCVNVAEIAAHAFEYFRRNVADNVTITGQGTIVAPIDTLPLSFATGWRATTFGRDLVRALCEGAGDRA